MATVKVKGVDTHIESGFLIPGDRALNFTLVNEALETKTLESFSGKIKVLITVPSIDTDVCARETKLINEIATSHPEIVFLVISKDLPFAQKRFCGKENLKNLVTLSDMRPTSLFARNYGIGIKAGPLEGLLARSIIVLDQHDKVSYSELVEELSEMPNLEALKGALRHT